MVSRFHSWWKLIKKFRAVLISSVVVILIALVVAGYVFNLDWMGLNEYSTTSVITDLSSKKMTRTEYFLPGKTFWDWMQLLFVPSVLTLGAVWFTARQNHDREIAHEQHKNDRDIAIDNQREAELQAYIDKMSELLLVNDLRESTEDAEVRKIVRVRTLTVLHRLDAERKGSVLRFLYESDLIDMGKRIIDLSGANLSEANLSHADLSGANLSRADLSKANLGGATLRRATLRYATLRHADLSHADLSGANLGGAWLSRADLSKANLGGAILSGADLGGADLNGADLNGANLVEADLMDADLNGAKLSDANLGGARLIRTNLSGAIVTPEQLDKVYSLKDSILPDGAKHSD